MVELQTMPLRSRVWDKERREFVPGSAFTIDGDGSLTVNVPITLADGTIAYKPYDDDFDRFIISHDTGVKDIDGGSIFTGDILELGNEYWEVFYNTNCGAICIKRGKMQYSLGDPFLWQLKNTFDGYRLTAKKVGNIWQDIEPSERMIR